MNFWSNHSNSIREKIDLNEISNWRNFQSVRDTMYPSCLMDFQLQDLGVGHEKEYDILRSYCHKDYPIEDFRGLLNQYYHLQVYKKHTGHNPINFSSIIEFGGGYGALVRVLTIFGYSGDYTIIDIPEVIEIQKQYIQVEQNITLPIKWTTEHNVSGADLFWATWSFAEVEENRTSLEKFDCRSHLIGYCRTWTPNQFDNTLYFNKFIQDNKDRYNFWSQSMEFNSEYLISYMK